MTWSDIPGRTAYLWIYEEFLKLPPRHGAVVVEVGVALGKCVAFLAESLEAMGRPDVAIYGVDAWHGLAQNGEQQALGTQAGGDFSLYARQMLEHSPRAFEHIRPIRMLSVEGASAFPPRCLDLVVLDAGHGYDDVRADLEVWLPRMRPGGWIGGDDFGEDNPGVEAAVRERWPDGRLEVRHEQNWPTWLRRLP